MENESITLFHCSPVIIEKIDPNYFSAADFYGTLFFADSPYSPSCMCL